jgi:hypothetical protein
MLDPSMPKGIQLIDNRSLIVVMRGWHADRIKKPDRLFVERRNGLKLLESAEMLRAEVPFTSDARSF